MEPTAAEGRPGRLKLRLAVGLSLGVCLRGRTKKGTPGSRGPRNARGSSHLRQCLRMCTMGFMGFIGEIRGVTGDNPSALTYLVCKQPGRVHVLSQCLVAGREGENDIAWAMWGIAFQQQRPGRHKVRVASVLVKAARARKAPPTKARAHNSSWSAQLMLARAA